MAFATECFDCEGKLLIGDLGEGHELDLVCTECGKVFTVNVKDD